LTFSPSQFGYFRFEKVVLERVASDTIFINFSVRNSPDGEYGMLSFDWEVHQTYYDQEDRVKIYSSEYENDTKLTRVWGSVNFNFCKFINGSATTFFTRVLTEHFFKSLNSNYSCPVVKGTKNSAKDLKITDHSFPPFSQEIKMRMEYQSFVKIKNEKKFRILYKANYFMSVKK
jgi:Protein of unknown function (DUF1091)